MAQKVILVADPGIDAAFAIALALNDPDLEVLALAATAGNVSADQATQATPTSSSSRSTRRAGRAWAPRCRERVRRRRRRPARPRRPGRPRLPLRPAAPLAAPATSSSPTRCGSTPARWPSSSSARHGPGPGARPRPGAGPAHPAPRRRRRRGHRAGRRDRRSPSSTSGATPPSARQVLRCSAPITLLPLDVTRKLVFSPARLRQARRRRDAHGRLPRQDPAARCSRRRRAGSASRASTSTTRSPWSRWPGRWPSPPTPRPWTWRRAAS